MIARRLITKCSAKQSVQMTMALVSFACERVSRTTARRVCGWVSRMRETGEDRRWALAAETPEDGRGPPTKQKQGRQNKARSDVDKTRHAPLGADSSRLEQIGADWSRFSRTCAREPQQNATSVLLRMRDLTLRHASSTFDARSVSSSSAVRSKADPLVWWRFRVTAVLPPPCCCHTPAANVDAYLFFLIKK